MFAFTHFRACFAATTPLVVDDLDGVPLYFSDQGKIQVEYGSRRVLKQIHLSTIQDEIDSLHFNLEIAIGKIKLINGKSPEFDEMYLSVLQECGALENDMNRLYNLAGMKSRPKRGLFDGVGTGFKYLFGTMSHDDEQEIMKHLQLLNDNNKNMEYRSTETLAIIQELNEAHKILKNNQDKEKEMINQLIAVVNEVKMQGGEQYRRIKDTQTHFINWIFHIRLEIAGVHNGMLFFKAGVFDTFVLDREEIAKSINMNFNTGYKIEPSDVDSLLDNTNRTLFADTNTSTVYLAIVVPVTHHETFQLYEIHSIPQYINNTHAIIMEDVSNYMVVNENRTTFWTGDDFKYKKIGSTVMGRVSPLREITTEAGCEITVMTYKEDKLCAYKELKKELKIVKRTGNGYIFVNPTEEAITFECEEGVRGIKNIFKTTFIDNNDNCHIWGNDFDIEKFITEDSVNLTDYKGIIFNSTTLVINKVFDPIQPMELDTVNDPTSHIDRLATWIRENKLETAAVITVVSLPIGLIIIIILVFLILKCRRAENARIFIDSIV